MRKVISVLLLAGFVFYVLTLGAVLFTEDAGTSPGPVGRSVLEGARDEAGAANTVT